MATIDASRFGETGDVRSNFALADVFGVDFAGLPATSDEEVLDANFNIGLGERYWEKRKSVYDIRLGEHEITTHPRFDEYVGEAPATMKGPALAVRRSDDSPAASAITTFTPWEKSEPTYPAVVTNKFGDGRVVYMPAGVDAAYYLYPYPYQRLLLSRAITWAANAVPPVVVKAPMCVQMTCFRQVKDGERLIVHLFNDINTSGNHALPDDDVPLREETIPIHNIRVTFAPHYNIVRAHLEPGGADLNIRQNHEGLTVTVPQLDIHSMVVAELE